ncbi:MAG: hypothetical protein RL434_2961 [Pseudomonadota bacterium]|jgi:two-component system phosphate regulon response regulator OmpR
MTAAGDIILVVDDDATVRELLADYLGSHQYQVLCAANGEEARTLLAAHHPRVVLLDIGLPLEDGLSLARFIREQYDIGILMVSGAGETIDRIVGLEVGADDYLAKPFDLRELRARLKSILRRYAREPVPQAPPETHQVVMGRATLDLDTRQLLDAGGEELPLTSAEFELLKTFAERPNRPLTRDQLMSLTRNREWDPLDRSIDIRIARLRRRIEPDPDNPSVLKTVRGVGYMFTSARQH